MTGKTDDEIVKEIPASRIAGWDRWGVDLIEADLKGTGVKYVGGPLEARLQAAAWVRVKRRDAATLARNEQNAAADVINIKPGAFGFTVDVNALWRRMRVWLRAKR